MRYTTVCTNTCAKIRQQSAFKRPPNLEKARIIPWDVSEKKGSVILTKSGVACTVCYVNCFGQPTTTSKTCLPISNSGEYRKAFKRKWLKESKNLRRIAKGAILFERSEFLIATSKKKKSVRLCGCSTNLGFSVENTNLGFSVGYVLCASYVCTWYQPADHSICVCSTTSLMLCLLLMLMLPVSYTHLTLPTICSV